jgi:hypothetical protein
MAAWSEKKDDPPAPMILPGQFEIVVTEEGTDLREVVIPPGKKKAPHPEQFALGLSEF